MSQLTFDFDVETPTLEPWYFPTMQTPENGGKCRDCHRPIKGRYSRCSGGLGSEGWHAVCDDCVVAAWAIQRADA